MRYLNGQRSFRSVLGELITPCTGVFLVLIVTLFTALFALFVIHTLFLWLSTDPEKAFHNARSVVGVVEKGWDGLRFVWNFAMGMMVDGAETVNQLAKHVVEPGVNIALEVLTQIAFQKHYTGLITDSPDGVPFRGHYCAEPTVDENGRVVGYDVDTMSMESLEFCSWGTVESWAAALNAAVEDEPGNVISNGSTLLLSTQHARKLAKKFAAQKTKGKDSGSLFPNIPLGPLFGALNAYIGLQALVYTTAFDIAAHVAYTILSEMAVALFNLLQIIIKAIVSLIQVTIRSGIVQNLVRMGLDLLMTLVTHVMLPLLFAFLDMVMCLFGFAQPATWDAQLVCVERSCFTESGSVGSEIFTVFTSIPVISHAVTAAVEALINPASGRKYGESATGTTETPDIPQTGVHESVAAATCAACFSCKIPEMRALWLLVRALLRTRLIPIDTPTQHDIHNYAMRFFRPKKSHSSSIVVVVATYTPYIRTCTQDQH
jgi:hypothetical protein